MTEHPIVTAAKAKLAAGQQLDHQDAISLLRVQVEKKGANFVYQLRESPMDGSPRCENTTTDAEGNRVPDCIVGHVLSDLWGAARVPSGGTVRRALAMMDKPGRFSEEALHVLEIAQVQQDDGHPWGKAVREASLG